MRLPKIYRIAFHGPAKSDSCTMLLPVLTYVTHRKAPSNATVDTMHIYNDNMQKYHAKFVMVFT